MAQEENLTDEQKALGRCWKCTSPVWARETEGLCERHWKMQQMEDADGWTVGFTKVKGGPKLYHVAHQTMPIQLRCLDQEHANRVYSSVCSCVAYVLEDHMKEKP